MKDYLAGVVTMALAGMVPGGAVVLYGLLFGGGEVLKASLLCAAAIILLAVGTFTAEWFTPGSHYRSLFKKEEHPKRTPQPNRPFGA
ncbi:MAG: hypothetical protein HYZ09_01180 [Candidatus Kerfeldbacteria bacterium]|nr:hypothetical protein [Candidatus Kerfeldbacteria bacterium]